MHRARQEATQYKQYYGINMPGAVTKNTFDPI